MRSSGRGRHRANVLKGPFSGVPAETPPSHSLRLLLPSPFSRRYPCPHPAGLNASPVSRAAKFREVDGEQGKQPTWAMGTTSLSSTLVAQARPGLSRHEPRRVIATTLLEQRRENVQGF